MSTRTTTSRKSCGTAERAETTESCDSLSTTRSSSAERVCRGGRGGTSWSVEGYDVITSDEHKLGHVVGTMGDNLVVEHGMLHKTKHPVPKTFAHVDEGEQVVRLTISKEIVEEAPKVNGDELDELAVAEHYGLAAGFEAPETE